MGIFLTLNNIDRFPGLVVRVKGAGDEIEINYESLEPPQENTGSAETPPPDPRIVNMAVNFEMPPNVNLDEARRAVDEAMRKFCLKAQGAAFTP